ncbi:hypothetical protein HEK616_57720 [Streptomyces nigrescens]|uniref:Uncharacterized protein n=1 Tax=Streptomyces nigrescens TaxID=1920 RepID=A0ABM8A0Z7_STRNI|nr:hypothetical protein [Streptomyces nigrescens]BDM72285.1 hypothetical protein HEK616_57720 [Streptomyces nigrescens]
MNAATDPHGPAPWPHALLDVAALRRAGARPVPFRQFVLKVRPCPARRGTWRAVGPDHPWTLGCAVNAANARSLVGQVVDAAELSGTTAQRAARTLGGTHPLSLASRTVAGPRRRSSGWDFEPQPI